MRACPILLCSRSSPFTEADPASHKRDCTRGRISPTFTRKVGLRWTCVRSFCLSRQPSAYVARKDPTSPSLLATRNLRTAIKRVRNDLVLEESQSPEENSCRETTATFARSMGAHTRCTMLAIAVVSRKTERKNPISAPLRKAERNPIPQSSPSRS